MTFKLEFNCDSAAFDEKPKVEIERILRDVLYRVVEDDKDNGSITDLCGNVVGEFKISGY